MNVFFISLFIAFTPFKSSYQNQQLILPETVFNWCFDTKNSTLYLFSNTHVYETPLSDFSKIKKTALKTSSYILKNFTPIRAKNKFYFVSNTGGTVLQMEKDQIFQIDNSYAHNLQHASTIFNYKNKIYRYGGYGFFSVRDFLLEYDFTTNEWETISTTSDIRPTGRFSNAHFLDEDILYIAAGTTVNKKNRNKRRELQDLWAFSFLNKTWTKKGDSQYLRQYNNNSFLLDAQLTTLYNQKIYTLNVPKQEINEYQINNTSSRLNPKFRPFSFKNSLYFVITRSTKERLLISRTKEEFLGQPLANIALKKKINYIFWGPLLALFIIIIYILQIKISKYKNNLFLNEKRIKFRNKVVELTPNEYNILKLFVQSPLGVENNIIQERINQPQYDRSHSVRLKNNLIESLNTKFQIIFEKFDTKFIHKEASSFDKRFKKYRLKLGSISLIAEES